MRIAGDGAQAPHVTIEERGRSAGRGAYLCAEPACWERALDGKVLERALRGAVTDADRDTLRTFAERRFAADAATEGAR